MGSGKKIARYRKRKSVNVGVLVFLIIFIYVLISVYIYFTKDHLTIYEVLEGSTSDDIVFTGLILRDEEVIYTDTAGYISYFHGDGDRVAKNATIYSLDGNKDTYDLIDSSDDTIALTKDKTDSLKKDILNFQKNYKDSNYHSVYNFKYEMENTVLEIVNDSKLEQLQSILDENGLDNSLKVVKSKTSGIITYWIDNYENLSADKITKDSFNMQDYKKTQLRTMELIEKGSPVYKIIKSDDWSVIVPLSKEQLKQLEDKDSVKVTFNDDGLTTTASLTIFQNDSNYYGKLDFTKYMIRYMNQRFVNIEIAINSAKGLKIPVSSIVKKDFYLVPLSFFTKGGDSNSTGLVKKTYKENGEVQYTFIPADIYYSDKTYGYVDARLFEAGDVIYSEEKDEEYTISKKKSLKGVYNVNKGYAVFRRIEILYKNEEYCIVKKGTQYGLSVYDHIALDGKTAVEQKIIY